MMTGRSVISRIRPHLKWLNQARYMRPSVKIAKDRFIVTMDVKNFFKDEITVTAKQDYVLIEGRQERKCKNGFVVRQFVRKFKLPEGCSPSRMETRLSQNGILTFIAHRYANEIPSPWDRKLPIQCADEDSCVPVVQKPCYVPQNPCCMPPTMCPYNFPQNPCCMPRCPNAIESENACEDRDKACEVKIKVIDEKDCCTPILPLSDNKPENYPTPSPPSSDKKPENNPKQ